MGRGVVTNQATSPCLPSWVLTEMTETISKEITKQIRFTFKAGFVSSAEPTYSNVSVRLLLNKYLRI
jgi:hypothetical protein